MVRDRVIAIHQPNFLPWLGYFNKIARADYFVFLDNAQFPKTGGTWINRVQLLINGQPAWATVPIVRSYHGLRLINEMEINNTSNWRIKILKTLQTNYSRAPFFSSVFPFISEIIEYKCDLLAEYNINAIAALVRQLNLYPEKLIKESSMEINQVATDRLIALTHELQGTAYLYGGGAGGYQENEKFKAASIRLMPQNFQHPIYHQFQVSEFFPGLSVVDALMNCGFEETRNLIILNTEKKTH
jgi:hypothetical protein